MIIIILIMIVIVVVVVVVVVVVLLLLLNIIIITTIIIIITVPACGSARMQARSRADGCAATGVGMREREEKRVCTPAHA